MFTNIHDMRKSNRETAEISDRRLKLTAKERKIHGKPPMFTGYINI